MWITKVSIIFIGENPAGQVLECCPILVA